MIDIETVIARVKTAVPSLSSRVAGTASLERALAAEHLAVPSAFVVPLGEQASEVLTVPSITQTIEYVLGVVVAVDNTSDERGQTAADSLRAVRDELVAGLVGWTPDAALYDPLEYASAEIQEISAARLWWRFQFASRAVLVQT